MVTTSRFYALVNSTVPHYSLSHYICPLIKEQDKATSEDKVAISNDDNAIQ